MAANITPEKYLDDLTSLLGQSGCIRSSHDVDKIISRMQDPKLLLVPQTVLTGVIKATKAPSTLDKFMSSGGWEILNTWLEDSMKKGEENFPYLMCLLDVLRKLPVTVQYLQRGNIGKLVKQLKKSEDADVSLAASVLLKEWLSVVKKHQTPSSQAKEAMDKEKKKIEEDKKALGAMGPISASVRAKETAKPVARPKRGKVKKKPDEDKAEEPAEKRMKPADLTKLGAAERKEKVKSPTAPPIESAGFMNALSSASIPKVRKRMKSQPPLVHKSSPATSRTDATLESPKDSRSSIDTAAPKTEAESGPLVEEPMDTGDPLPPIPPYSGGGVLVHPGQRNRVRKRVTWAPVETMRDVYYFEIEEGERVNMHAKNFLDIAKMEKEREAVALREARVKFRSEAVESIPPQVYAGTKVLKNLKSGERKFFSESDWHLIPFLMETQNPVQPGCKSSEKLKQERRESSTLAFLFLSKASLPDTAFEPELDLADSRLLTEPKLIPITDESDPTGGMPGPAPMPSNISPISAHSSPGLDSTQTQATVQNLLDKLKTKGVLGSDSAAGPPPGAALQQGGPGMAPPFAGQPMPNRPPNMPPMFEGNMPRHPHQQNMGPPGPHPPGPHGPDPMYPPGPGMRPPFAPQEGPPPPMGRSGPSWRPMGPGGAPSGLLPTPAGPTTGPGPGPGGYQEDTARQDYHGGGGEMGHGEDFDGRMHGRGGGGGRGTFRGRGRGRGRGAPCRHYMSPRGCTMGDKCRFFHPAPGSLDDWESGGGGGGPGYNPRMPFRGGPPGQFAQGPRQQHQPRHGPPVGQHQSIDAAPGPGQFGQNTSHPPAQHASGPGGVHVNPNAPHSLCPTSTALSHSQAEQVQVAADGRGRHPVAPAPNPAVAAAASSASLAATPNAPASAAPTNNLSADINFRNLDSSNSLSGAEQVSAPPADVNCTQVNPNTSSVLETGRGVIHTSQPSTAVESAPVQSTSATESAS